MYSAYILRKSCEEHWYVIYMYFTPMRVPTGGDDIRNAVVLQVCSQSEGAPQERCQSGREESVRLVGKEQTFKIIM